jgi:fructoselysine-6-P-deglycase FrlB-like protein
MTTFHHALRQGPFRLTGSDVASMRFKSRPEARDLVQAAYPRLAGQGERKEYVEAAAWPRAHVPGYASRPAGLDVA